MKQNSLRRQQFTTVGGSGSVVPKLGASPSPWELLSNANSRPDLLTQKLQEAEPGCLAFRSLQVMFMPRVGEPVSGMLPPNPPLVCVPSNLSSRRRDQRQCWLIISL